MNTEIAEYIKNHIREYLPPEYQEAHITLEEVTKEMTGGLPAL